MRSPLGKLSDRLMAAFGFGLLKVIDDTGDQQVAQLNLNVGSPIAEVIDKTVRLGEYGFNSCPPEGAEAIAVFLGGRRTSGVIIATGYRKVRSKGLLPGECNLFNALSGDFVQLCQDGKVRSQTTDWLHDGDYHVTGTMFAAHVIPADGWDGTFETGDGRTATVTHGIITDVS